MDVRIDPEQLETWLTQFATYGAYGDTGVWRTLYFAGVDSGGGPMPTGPVSGLEVRRDAVGNVWAPLEGREGGASIVTGSHIDTVTPGGRFDGALGTLGGLIAVASLMRQNGRPRRTLEAVALCEEESSRFRASFWGSRAIIGGISSGDPDKIIGFDGFTISDAMRTAQRRSLSQ